MFKKGLSGAQWVADQQAFQDDGFEDTLYPWKAPTYMVEGDFETSLVAPTTPQVITTYVCDLFF